MSQSFSDNSFSEIFSSESHWRQLQVKVMLAVPKNSATLVYKFALFDSPAEIKVLTKLFQKFCAKATVVKQVTILGRL